MCIFSEPDGFVLERGYVYESYEECSENFQSDIKQTTNEVCGSVSVIGILRKMNLTLRSPIQVMISDTFQTLMRGMNAFMAGQKGL